MKSVSQWQRAIGSRYFRGNSRNLRIFLAPWHVEPPCSVLAILMLASLSPAERCGFGADATA